MRPGARKPTTNTKEKLIRKPSSIIKSRGGEKDRDSTIVHADAGRRMRRQGSMRMTEMQLQQQQQEENPEDGFKPLDTKELNKTYERKLTSANPQAPKVTVHYDYVNKQFQQNTNVPQYIVHFSVDGETIQKDCPDDIIQEEILNARKKMMKETIDLHGLEPPTTDEERQEYRKIMRNKFNYSQRETQTPPVIIRDAKVSTAKPNLKNFKGTINQSTIWDLYVKAKMEMLSKEQKEPQKNQATAKDNSKEGQASLYSPNFKRCLKVMERMIMQNEQQSCYRNYKYMFTDQDGDFSKKNPSSVSLWNFDFDSTKKKNVTSICWNPKYSDMFAVGYGLYDFGKKKSVGYITICSLKNSKTSEMTFQTDGDVMSLDFHPYIPALLAVGLYDGVVLVYDIRNKTKQPIYQSSIKSKKHTDPVWQVKWNREKSEYNNFYSISSDGRVMNWILMKDKLEPEEVIRLKLVSNPLRNKNNKNKQTDEETSLISLACGLCFDFNQFDQFAFVVGTEEGNIHKCSKAYSGQYQKTYEGHQLAVYKVRWNPFHKDTFISASADWTMKIWDARIDTPVMSFDMKQVMVDVVWCPFNSGVFIALSLLRAYVYNLGKDRHGSATDLKPVNFEKLTNVAFNPKDPIFLIGDTRGKVGVFKLSRDLTEPDANDPMPGQPDWEKRQEENMSKLLELGNFDRDEDTDKI